jgi:hypothetical protein
LIGTDGYSCVRLRRDTSDTFYSEATHAASFPLHAYFIEGIRAAIRHRALRGAGQPLTRPLTAAERSRISRSGPGAPHHPRRGPAGQRRRRLREARRGGREGGRGVGGRCGTGRGSVGRGVGVARGGGKRRESGVGTKRIFCIGVPWPHKKVQHKKVHNSDPSDPG